MADSSFAPPPGPPPPKVPEGWKAVWNAEYKEWFFVNIYTKKSQWDKPTEPVYPPGEGPDGPSDAPPSYNHDEAKPVAAEKTGLSANNPYAMHGAAGGSSHDMSEDEKLARQLQEEENAKAGRRGDRGEADTYYGTPGAAGTPAIYGQQPQQYGNPSSSSFDQELPPRPEEKGKSKGLLGKLLGKSSHKPQYGAGYPAQQYPPQQQYYGPPQQGPYGYPPQQGYYQQAPPPGRRPGGGMGAAGGAALGLGAGLLGGALIADAVDGGDGGGDDGGDFGGGDFGGGDF